MYNLRDSIIEKFLYNSVAYNYATQQPLTAERLLNSPFLRPERYVSGARPEVKQLRANPQAIEEFAAEIRAALPPRVAVSVLISTLTEVEKAARAAHVGTYPTWESACTDQYPASLHVPGQKLIWLDNPNGEVIRQLNRRSDGLSWRLQTQGWFMYATQSTSLDWFFIFLRSPKGRAYRFWFPSSPYVNQFLKVAEALMLNESVQRNT